MIETKHKKTKPTNVLSVKTQGLVLSASLVSSAQILALPAKRKIGFVRVNSMVNG